MLPAQRNKVDISKLTPEEQKAFRMYGKLPARPVAKSQERKYFDSGDWALSRSGKAEHANVPLGKSMPKPDEIPHASPTPLGTSVGSASAGSPSSSSSPPGATPISPSGLAGSASSSAAFGGMTSPSSGTSSIPLGGGAGASGVNHESGINLSMSPGRVGVGQPLATSPTRSFGSIADRVSPTSGGASGLGSRLERESSYSGTTGNHIGRTQIRRTSQSEGVPLGVGGNSHGIGGASPASPPPSSGLAQSISAHETSNMATEDESVAGMELQ